MTLLQKLIHEIDIVPHDKQTKNRLIRIRGKVLHRENLTAQEVKFLKIHNIIE